ncbi:MAG: M24 family metallopeptidase [Promethearchaeota archaeon]
MVNKEILNQAGIIAVEVLREAWREVQPGASILNLCEKYEQRIQDKGGKPAFPLNLSLNACAAHDTAAPKDKRVLPESFIAKIDIGVHIDGHIADCAITKAIGKNEPNTKELVNTAKLALEAAIEHCKAGITPGNIGEVVERVIMREGFIPISNLTGHEIDLYNLHTGLSIPSVQSNTMYHRHKLKKDMVIAIEPFVTFPEKNGRVMYSENPLIFALNRHENTSLSEKIVKRYGFLPFALRWATDLISDSNYSHYLQGLRKYPPLIEETNGLVTQAEATVIVGRNGCEVTTPVL